MRQQGQFSDCVATVYWRTVWIMEKVHFTYLSGRIQHYFNSILLEACKVLVCFPDSFVQEDYSVYHFVLSFSCAVLWLSQSMLVFEFTFSFIRFWVSDHTFFWPFWHITPHFVANHKLLISGRDWCEYQAGRKKIADRLILSRRGAVYA